MKPQFYRKKLKNGLTVLFEKRNLPVISVGLACKFGSAYETEEEKGTAHFIEHMLFKGTKKRTSKQIVDEITGKGGEYNAFTAKTFTAAWLKLPSRYIDFSVDILSDLFHNAQFHEKELEKERRAILEEIKMYHDTPMRHVFEELSKLMYDKPFGSPALGTEKTVSKFTRKDLTKKYKENYSTGNFVLCVVGDSDFNKIIKLCEKYFKKTEKTKESKLLTPVKKFGTKIEKRKELHQAHISFGIHFPTSIDKKRYAASIFSSIFVGDPSSRVYQEIREKRGLAYAILGGLEQEKIHGEQIVYIGTLKNKVNLVKKIIASEFKKMSDIKEKELEMIKEKLINLNSLEREDSKNVLFNLLFEEVSGNAEEYYKYAEKINSVKLEDVRNLAKLKGFSFVALVPE